MPKPHSIIIYGESGDTKTSQLYHAFKYYHAKTSKRGRLITADGGGCAPFEDSGLVRAYWSGSPNQIRLDIRNREGVLDVFDVSNMSAHGFSTIRKLGQGFWPNYVNGQPLWGTYQECWHEATELDKVGCYMVEGASSICDMWLAGLSKRADNLGFKAAYTIREEDEVISGLQEGHYGIAQRELRNIVVEGFETLPVDLMMFTALVASGRIKRTGESVYGPQGAGQAMTNTIPSWFMDTIHLENIQVQNQQNGQPGQPQMSDIKVAWFQRHQDPNTHIPYLAKSRITPEYYEKLLEFFPYGAVQLDFKKGFARYLEALDRIRELQRGEISEEQFREIVRGG